jgi:hypothetical protein
MITITTFAFSTDMTYINLVMDASTGKHFTTLHAFLNGAYLSPEPIDLTSKLTGAQTETLTILNTDLELTSDSTIKGIVTIYAVSSATSDNTISKAIYNSYFIDLCLANMIVNQEVQEGFDEISTIYFLNKAIITDLSATPQRIEHSLNAYERVVAMCEKNPAYLVDEDLATSSGSGEWIINGTYIIN